MRTLRAALIGAGWISAGHLEAIDAAEDVELVAVCDVDPARAQAAASPRGARALACWEDLLESERLDVLWICTPPLAHRDPAVAALQRGIAVYLEKPLARDAQDAEAIAQAAATSGSVCAVGYQWHASDLLRQARCALEGRAIGLLCGRNYGAVAERPWFVRRQSGGGQILERGSHQIDLQRALAGEVVAVQAVGSSVRICDNGHGDIEDIVGLTMRFANGALGFVTLAWTAPGQPGLYGLDVIAEHASIWLELGPERFTIGGRAGTHELAGTDVDPLAQSVARFLQAARKGDPQLVPCPPDDALRTLAVALGCERSLQQGGSSVSV
jgi:myo-inositol 2-dehydrogenase/D-chiro-inositol 1-dehydrogenase